MHYILTYELVENYIKDRQAFRQLHFDHVKASQAKGEFKMGGALDPPDKAVLVFKTEHPENIEEFVKTDPYYKAGLVSNYSIQKWVVVIGGGEDLKLKS